MCLRVIRGHFLYNKFGRYGRFGRWFKNFFFSMVLLRLCSLVTGNRQGKLLCIKSECVCSIVTFSILSIRKLSFQGNSEVT